MQQSNEDAVARVKSLDDVELVAGLHRLVRSNQALTARLLVHLGEMDARGLYREHAFDSMFAYAVKELHMSEAEAYLRIQAARLAREYPIILPMLVNGEVHLTAIKLLGPHLTIENHVNLLKRARFKAKREIELIVAEVAPKPDVPSRMRKLPERVSARVTEPSAETANSAQSAAHGSGVTGGSTETTNTLQPQVRMAPTVLPKSPIERAPLPPALHAFADVKQRDHEPLVDALAPNPTIEILQDTASSRAVTTVEREREAFQLKSPPPSVSSTTPLSPGRYLIAFTASRSMHDTLERLRNLLRHQVPDGNLAIILERAAVLLLEKTMKERFAQTKKRSHSRAGDSSNGGSVVPPSQSVPAADGGGTCLSSVVGTQLPCSSESTESQTLDTRSHPNGPPSRHALAGTADATGACVSATQPPDPRSRSVESGRCGSTDERAMDRSVQSAHSETYRYETGPHAAEASANLTDSHSATSDRSAGNSIACRGLPQLCPEEVELQRSKSGAASTARSSRYVPREVVRAVHARDGEQCTFVSADGRRCEARTFLELHHHETPHAKGGSSTTANLRLVCRAHNALFAERDFGRALMQSKLVHARQRKSVATNRLGPESEQARSSRVTFP